jgi:hypothetical protein
MESHCNGSMLVGAGPLHWVTGVLQADHQARCEFLEQRHQELLSHLCLYFGQSVHLTEGENHVQTPVSHSALRAVSKDSFTSMSKPVRFHERESETNVDPPSLSVKVSEETIVAPPSLPELESPSVEKAPSLTAVDEEQSQSLQVVHTASHQSKRKKHKSIREMRRANSDRIKRLWFSQAPAVKEVTEVVYGQSFEYIFSTLIVMNSVSICFEAQYTGHQIGYEQQYSGYMRPAKDIWPKGEITFKILEMVFGICFTFEVFLKLLAMQQRFFKSVWNLFDAFIIISWLVSEIGGATLLMNPMVLRIARLARLLRMLGSPEPFKSLILYTS